VPYIKHPLFVPPPPDTVMYRYMTLGKLLHTVQTGRLWFTNTRLMEKHEGRLGAADKEPQQYLAAYGADMAAMLYLSCWSEGPHESNAMWKLYVGDGEGVCIRSTVARFTDAASPEAGEVLLGRVKYVDFYHHDQHWSNRMILGDSLLVMTSLAEKEGLKGKVQTIFIDPPYGIKFGSNWQVSTRRRDVKDGRAEDATRQPEQVRAFRDTWKLGIHSYLAYLRDRLEAARILVSETGGVFVQIGVENVHLVRCLLDEVFGSANFCAQIAFRKTTGKGSDLIDSTFDTLLWYAKDRESVKYRPLFEKRTVADEDNLRFARLSDDTVRRISDDEASNPDTLPRGARLFRPNPLTNQRPAQGNDLRAYQFRGRSYSPGSGTYRTDKAGMDRLALAERLMPVGSYLTFIRYLDDFPFKPRSDIWDDTRSGGYGEDKTYVVQTISRVVERCLLMSTDPGDLVLDPTCGSGTTAFVAEHRGRRWITVDTSRVALALARTRLMAAKYPYYLLVDSAEGARKEAEITGRPVQSASSSGDIRHGFVCERVRHVTLRSIANNPDVREGMSRAAIDDAIARHAETETLVDRPYEDPRRVRVSGPFTVESLSPHRVLSTDESGAGGMAPAAAPSGAVSFEATILENLKKAGVQNTKRNERLVFDRLDPRAGLWIQGDGEFTDADGKTRRVGLSRAFALVTRATRSPRDFLDRA